MRGIVVADDGTGPGQVLTMTELPQRPRRGTVG
jgi:hypothetical protein